jgi:hypothetical protein
MFFRRYRNTVMRSIWRRSLAALALMLCLGGVAGAQQQPCPLTMTPKIDAGTIYKVVTPDNCWWIMLTNTGSVTVQLPAPGLIFPAGFTTTILPLNGASVTLVGLPDEAGVVHKINGAAFLNIGQGQGATLKIQQDMNWYALATGSTVGGSAAGALTGNTLASNVVNSSLTTVGVLSELTVSGSFTATGLVTNTDLEHSTITLGSTTLTLGGVTTSVAGLTLASPTVTGAFTATGLVKNADLAGSITSSKLIGSDIATVGTLTVGAINWAGNIATSGTISTSNTTASTSKTTGATVVTGGLGVGKSIWAGKGNFTDAQSGGITATDAAMAVYSNEVAGITANYIANCVVFTSCVDYPSGFANLYSVYSGVMDVPSGTSKIVGVYGAYLRSGVAGAAGSIGYIGEFVADVDGATVWGGNWLCTDHSGQVLTPGSTGRACIGMEWDFNIVSTSSQVFGAIVQGSSLAQPTVATGYLVGCLDSYTTCGSVSKWLTAFQAKDGASDVFATIGAQAAPGASKNSQRIDFHAYDSGAALIDASLQYFSNKAFGIGVDTGGAVFFSFGGVNAAAVGAGGYSVGGYAGLTAVIGTGGASCVLTFVGGLVVDQAGC